MFYCVSILLGVELDREGRAELNLEGVLEDVRVGVLDGDEDGEARSRWDSRIVSDEARTGLGLPSTSVRSFLRVLGVINSALRRLRPVSVGICKRGSVVWDSSEQEGESDVMLLVVMDAATFGVDGIVLQLIFSGEWG